MGHGFDVLNRLFSPIVVLGFALFFAAVIGAGYLILKRRPARQAWLALAGGLTFLPQVLTKLLEPDYPEFSAWLFFIVTAVWVLAIIQFNRTFNRMVRQDSKRFSVKRPELKDDV